MNKRSYSISLTKEQKDSLCSGFDGSLSRTFLFLSELMQKAYQQGLIPDELVNEVMDNQKQQANKRKGK